MIATRRTALLALALAAACHQEKERAPRWPTGYDQPTPARCTLALSGRAAQEAPCTWSTRADGPGAQLVVDTSWTDAQGPHTASLKLLVQPEHGRPVRTGETYTRSAKTLWVWGSLDEQGRGWVADPAETFSHLRLVVEDVVAPHGRLSGLLFSASPDDVHPPLVFTLTF